MCTVLKGCVKLQSYRKSKLVCLDGYSPPKPMVVPATPWPLPFFLIVQTGKVTVQWKWWIYNRLTKCKGKQSSIKLQLHNLWIMQHNIWILTLNLFIVPSVVAVYAETLKVWFKTSGESEAVAQLVESALTLQAWCPPGWGEPRKQNKKQPNNYYGSGFIGLSILNILWAIPLWTLGRSVGNKPPVFVWGKNVGLRGPQQCGLRLNHHSFGIVGLLFFFLICFVLLCRLFVVFICHFVFVSSVLSWS